MEEDGYIKSRRGPSKP